MTDQTQIDARLEQALSVEFSNRDSAHFSKKVAGSISRLAYRRYLVLAAGWLTGLLAVLSVLPTLVNTLTDTILAPSQRLFTDWVYQPLPPQLVSWLVPTLIVLIAVVPALLFRKRTGNQAGI